MAFNYQINITHRNIVNLRQSGRESRIRIMARKGNNEVPTNEGQTNEVPTNEGQLISY